jgi:hypothetical protein
MDFLTDLQSGDLYTDQTAVSYGNTTNATVGLYGVSLAAPIAQVFFALKNADMFVKYTGYTLLLIEVVALILVAIQLAKVNHAIKFTNQYVYDMNYLGWTNCTNDYYLNGYWRFQRYNQAIDAMNY